MNSKDKISKISKISKINEKNIKLTMFLFYERKFASRF